MCIRDSPWTCRIQGCGAIEPRPKASSPLIVIPTAPNGAIVLEAVKVWLARLKYAARLVQRPTLTASARAGVSETTVGTKKQTFKSNKETDEEKRWTALLKLLD